jgi:hypothetical protein
MCPHPLSIQRGADKIHVIAQVYLLNIQPSRECHIAGVLKLKRGRVGQHYLLAALVDLGRKVCKDGVGQVAALFLDHGHETAVTFLLFFVVELC